MYKTAKSSSVSCRWTQKSLLWSMQSTTPSAHFTAYTSSDP